jgi:hypothetical protein
MPSLGTKKINKMLTLDYADGKPFGVFRAEIDIPLGGDYSKLKKLLDGTKSDKNNEKIVDLLLSKLGNVSSQATAAEKGRHKAARHFLAAAFDREPKK